MTVDCLNNKTDLESASVVEGGPRVYGTDRDQRTDTKDLVVVAVAGSGMGSSVVYAVGVGGIDIMQAALDDPGQ